MKNFSTAYADHIASGSTTLAICWRIVKKNGELILGTTHDRNITVTQTNIGMEVSSPGFDLTGTYRASSGITASDIVSGSDMSVDNTEVKGAISRRPDLYIDVSVADMEAGLLDSAEVTTFRVNWQNPDDFQDVMRHGYLGEHSRTAEGEYRQEVRGLTQVLQQTIGRTCGERCDVAEFGDARCKKDVAALTVTGTITSVTDRKRFSASLTPIDSSTNNGYFTLGKLTMTSGDNDTYVRQVKNDSVGDVLGEFELWEPFPVDLEIGDTFTLTPGCDRRYETCRDVHDNLINFRGPGIFVPGMDSIIRAP